MKHAEAAEQMQLIGEIAVGLANEIRNPITGIKGALEVFHRELDLSKEERALFEEMLFQVKKLDVVTRSFLAYARPPAPRFVPLNVNEIIRDSVALVIQYNLHRNVRQVSVIEDFDESAPAVNADPVHLQQVFLNLTLNALDVMTDGGTLRYRTAHEGEYVVVEASHVGTLTDKGPTEKTFRQFSGTGTGTGLSVSKRLIEQHGGDMSVETAEDSTVIRARLPLFNTAFGDQASIFG